MSIKIELTKAEALVLHDLLYRISKNSDYFEDIAEQYVLWSIECQLDKKVEPVDDYTENIRQARDTVRKNYLRELPQFNLNGVERLVYS